MRLKDLWHVNPQPSTPGKPLEEAHRLKSIRVLLTQLSPSFMASMLYLLFTRYKLQYLIIKFTVTRCYMSYKVL